jgi:N-acetylneuraminic acid mutarotase
MGVPKAWSNYALSTMDGRLYVLGGHDMQFQYLSSVEVYDPRENVWASVAPMPTARADPSVVAAGGYLFAVGGWWGSGVGSYAISVMERYDPASNTWAKMASMPQPIAGYAVAAAGNRIYCFGGYYYEPDDLTAVTLCYDLATNTWASAAPMPCPRWRHAASAIGDKIYVTGGCVPTGESKTALCYDTAANTWAPISPMNQAHYTHVSVAVDNQLVVIGCRSTECYDPTTDTWAPLFHFVNAYLSYGVGLLCL